MTNDPRNATCHNLFPTPLFVFNLKNHEGLNIQLLTTIYQLKKTDSGQVASNVLGWHSKGNLFALEEMQPFKKLVDEAIAAVSQTMGYAGVNVVAANCWANVNPKYASNKIHDHANCLFSGVYYVKPQ